MPRRPAYAIRWMIAFVEPEMACSVRIAFSNAARVTMSEGRMPQRTSSTICRPAASASWERRESAAGIAALLGSASPSASVMHAIVDAVPMTMQCPCERDIAFSSSAKSCSLIRPARSSSW
jgi:hypothetical protein